MGVVFSLVRGRCLQVDFILFAFWYDDALCVSACVVLFSPNFVVAMDVGVGGRRVISRRS